MLNTILIIIVSVAIFGVLFFLYIKKTLKKRLGSLLRKENKEKNQNFLNSSFGISKTFFDIS
jgi:hypothetical protein